MEKPTRLQERLQQILINELKADYFRLPRHKKENFWASDMLKCARAVWWSMKQEPKSNPPDATSIRRMRAGKLYELGLLLGLNEEGVLRDTQVRVKLPLGDTGYDLTGYLDAVVERDGELYIMEVKSIKDAAIYFTKKEAKADHLSQLGVYHMATPHVPRGILHYGARGECDIIEYHTRLIDDQFVKGAYAGREEVVDIDDGLTRLHMVAHYLKNDQLPEQSFTYKYDLKSADPASVGVVAKRKMKAALKGGWEPAVVGDWQCKYCDWKNKCLIDTEGGCLGYNASEKKVLAEFLEQ